MATEVIDGNTIRRVRGMLKKQDLGRIRDSSCPGLAIRIYKRRASWVIDTRDWKATIGALEEYTAEDLPLLRELVIRARAVKAEGRDPEPLLEAFRQERDVKLAAERADVEHGIGEAWEDVRDAFLAWVKDNRRPDTHRGYRSALGAVPNGDLEPDFKYLAGKPIVSITTKDLVRVRSSIVQRGKGEKIRQANLTVSALKSLYSWYINHPDSLLESNPAATLGKAMERRKESIDIDESDRRVFTQEEIGLLLKGMESEPNKSAQMALTLALLTGQRRMTVARARKSHFIPYAEFGLEGDGYVWRISGDKTHSWRVLPLPKEASRAVEIALTLARSDNEYLFPQQRPRRTGDQMDGHLNESRISRVIERLREKGGTLADAKFSPSAHDMRHTFITVMSPQMQDFQMGNTRLGRGDVRIITHADEGREGTASLVYDHSDYLDVKLSILQRWEQWCLEGREMVSKASSAA